MPTMPPALSFEPELLLRVQGVRAVFFDLDDLVISDTFNRRDAFGLRMLNEVGIQPLLFSGSSNAAALQASAMLGLNALQWSPAACRESAEKTLQQLGLAWSVVAVLSTDWPDLRLMQCAGFKAAAADAHPEVLALADWVSTSNAGNGAVREMCDLLLVGCGQYANLLQRYRHG